MPCSASSSCRFPSLTRALAVAVLLLAAAAPLVQGQPAERPDDAFYGKLGVGVSDYTGDFPAQNVGHPFDLQEFIRGSGLPVLVHGEAGYHLSPHLAVGLGVQVGNYPIVGYAGGRGISDSYRYTPQLLARYTFGRPSQTVAPYVDGGINATFGGATSTGIGPSVGAGVDILISESLSAFVESRFNLTAPDDAIDGSASLPNDAVTGSFDSVNQLLGFGVTMRFERPTAPQIVSLSAPSEASPDESITVAATLNESDVTRPVSTQWRFGDGTTGSGLTATHTYTHPGTYIVDFSARNEAGTVRDSLTITVPRPATPPQIASVDAHPSPVPVGTPVLFRSTTEGSGDLSYEWAFGDGATSTGASATHSYTAAGAYTAKLTVTSETGTDTRSVSVRVDEPVAPDTSQASSSAPASRSAAWGIVVASMRTTGGAEAMAQRYRTRIASSPLPVQIVPMDTRNGLRLRVVVGQFESGDAARQSVTERSDVLPADAWVVQLP